MVRCGNRDLANHSHKQCQRADHPAVHDPFRRQVLDGVSQRQVSDNRRRSSVGDYFMRAGRLIRSAVAGLVAVLVLPASALAEAPGNEGGTVNVGPVSKGPVVSQGSAGYDPNGITSTASTQPTASGTTSTAPSYTYRPVPGNSVPGACPTQHNGVISNPCAGLPTSVCPPAQTGYFVYDSSGDAIGLVCVASPTDSPRPAATPEIALADQASSRQPWPGLTLGIN